MSETGAQIGDSVTVWWHDGERMKGTVQYRPQAEGDSWVIHTDDGTIYHVQMFECMIVDSRKADSSNARPDAGREKGSP